MKCESQSIYRHDQRSRHGPRNQFGPNCVFGKENRAGRSAFNGSWENGVGCREETTRLILAMTVNDRGESQLVKMNLGRTRASPGVNSPTNCMEWLACRLGTTETGGII